MLLFFLKKKSGDNSWCCRAMDYLSALTRVANNAAYVMARDVSTAGPVFQDLLQQRLTACTHRQKKDVIVEHLLVFNLAASWLLYHMYNGRVPKPHFVVRGTAPLLRGIDYIRCNTPGNMTGLHGIRLWSDTPTAPAVAYAQMMALLDAQAMALELMQGTFDPDLNVVVEPNNAYFYMLDRTNHYYVRPWPLVLSAADLKLLVKRNRADLLGHLSTRLTDFHAQHLYLSKSQPVYIAPIVAEHMPLRSLTAAHEFRAMYTVFRHLSGLYYDVVAAMLGHDVIRALLTGPVGELSSLTSLPTSSSPTSPTSSASSPSPSPLPLPSRPSELTAAMADPEWCFYQHYKAYLFFVREL
jgi:hypothetical protein